MKTHPDGEALLAETETKAKAVLLHTSPTGQEVIREKLQALGGTLSELKEDTTFKANLMQKVVSLWESFIRSAKQFEEQLGIDDATLRAAMGPYGDEEVLSRALVDLQVMPLKGFYQIALAVIAVNICKFNTWSLGHVTTQLWFPLRCDYLSTG